MSEANDTKIWLRKMRTRFSCLDLNKNGLLTKEDFEVMSENFISHLKNTNEDQKTDVREKFAKLWAIQSNGDDCASVDLDAFIAKMRVVRDNPQIQNRYREYQKLVFQSIDADGDNTVSKDEYGAIVLAIGVDTKWLDQTFDAMDKNQDGKIQISEFLDAFMEFCVGNDEQSPNNNLYGSLLD